MHCHGTASRGRGRARVLSHVCIDDRTVDVWVPVLAKVLGADLSKHRPTRGGGPAIGICRTVDSGQLRPASRACFHRTHLRRPTYQASPTEPSDHALRPWRADLAQRLRAPLRCMRRLGPVRGSALDPIVRALLADRREAPTELAIT